MKKHLALLPIVFLTAVLFARASEADDKDVQPAPPAHRLDYVRFDPAAQTVEWGVSDGSVNDDGEFAPSGPPTTYVIDLNTGVITHGGQDGQLSPDDADNAYRAFQALSTLMQIFTEHWKDSDDPGLHNSQGSDPAGDASPDTRTISAPCPAGLHSQAADDKTARAVPNGSGVAAKTVQPIQAPSSSAGSTSRKSLTPVSLNTDCRKAVQQLFAIALLRSRLSALQLP